ncbi:hypothetical protein [Paenirhodobacter enshiensis]|uniref:hypothetical protein n=1 Tax=Paenirhodobacter enshiensis TaxID=1105367 RepID=UPI0035ADAA09
MGMMNLFRRNVGKSHNNETRSASGTGYTSAIIAARGAYIAGSSNCAELTATVQTAVGLWESGLSLADVDGTDLIDRASLAITARALALRGEAVFLIGERLTPAIDWDLATRDGVPRAYRLTVPEIGGGRSVTALAGEVLHFRIGSDAATPWAGSSPLKRSTLSADLLEQIEGGLRDVFRDAPLGSQIVPVPEGSADDMESLRTSFRGNRGAALVIEGVAQATAAGMNPNIGKSPDQLSPDLSRTLANSLLIEAKGAILSAYGVLPGWFNATTTGPLVREAQRHLAQWVLQPIAMQMAEEASRKLGGRVLIDVVRPAQAFDAGGKARALSTMVQALAQAKEAGIEGAALQDALSFIDWAD